MSGAPASDSAAGSDRAAAEAALDAPVTRDAFLGGRALAFQPAEGFRAAIDTVCLAAGIEAGRGADVLDAGAGAGIASLCLLTRLPGLRLTALEADSRLAALALVNFAAAGLAAEAVAGDLFAFAEKGQRFSQVMTNPPFAAGGAGTPPPHPGKARAHVTPGGLAPWIAACLSLLEPKGTLTLICRAGDLAGAVAALEAGAAGEVSVLPLWPGPGKAARRVLLRARRGVKSPSRLLPGLVLHAPGQRYTPEAERVLRAGEAIDWG